MKIGEKIKKLRTDKLMTQSELVGTEITRNMLSRIENGIANPSLNTILYIAERLNVSPGFLLAGEQDERIYLKHEEINDIKKAFITEDFRICRDMCLRSENSTDDEIQMILAECDLALAVEEFNVGRLRVACKYFDEALEHCGQTLYRTEYIVAVAGIYFRYMRRLSTTISSNVIDEAKVNIYPSLTDEFCRYVITMEHFDGGEETKEIFGSEFLQRESPFTLHQEAKHWMQRNNFEEAYQCLRAILLNERPIPQPVLYFVFCDFEICCREIRDFKGAYEYSLDKVELLQKLLT